MKLLSPTAHNTASKDQQLRTIIRNQELDKAAKEARIELANAESEYQTALARNRKNWALEEQEHEERVKERNIEIDRLEAKRLNAMIPINILKESAEEQLAEAETYVASIRKREEDNEILAEQLQNKLDEVGAKEQDLIKLSQELQIKSDSLIQQQASTVAGIKSLNTEMAKFAIDRGVDEERINQRKTELALIERTLVTKAAKLKYAEKDLEDLRIVLADERGTLQRAWQELERKKSK